MGAPVAVYKISNTINNKLYIGQSIRPKQRFIEHTWNSSKCKILSSALKKHGVDAFSLTILCWCPNKAYANNIEQGLITAYNTRNEGYNITIGGEGLGAGKDHPNYGKKASIATCNKLSENMRGVFNHRYGTITSDETRLKIAISLKDRIFTDEHRERISNGKKNKCPILITKDLETYTLPSITETIKFIGVTTKNLRKALLRNPSICKGWTIKRVSNDF